MIPAEQQKMAEPMLLARRRSLLAVNKKLSPSNQL